MQLLLPEIFEAVAKAATRDEKLAILRKHNTPQLRMFLTYAVYPDVKWQWGNEFPPYTRNANPTGLAPTSLYTETRRLYLFTASPASAHVPSRKKEMLFIQLMEAITPIEAQAVEDLITGVLCEKYGISYELVTDAFPFLKTVLKVPQSVNPCAEATAETVKPVPQVESEPEAHKKTAPKKRAPRKTAKK